MLDIEPPHEVTRTFPASLESIGYARSFVVGSLAATESATRMNAELAVSELVTNGIEHGAGHAVTVRVSTQGDMIELAVSSMLADGDAAPIVTAQADNRVPVVRTGRGLRIVAALSVEVRAFVDGQMLTVTCVLRPPTP